METQKKKSSSSAGWYALAGLIAGAAAGVLLAPRSGAETREAVEDWRRRGAERAREALERVGKAFAARAEHVSKEAASAARDGAKEFSPT